MDVLYAEYTGHLMDQAAFNIACLAKVHETDYEYFAQDDFRVRKPDIKIKVRLFSSDPDLRIAFFQLFYYEAAKHTGIVRTYLEVLVAEETSFLKDKLTYMFPKRNKSTGAGPTRASYKRRPHSVFSHVEYHSSRIELSVQLFSHRYLSFFYGYMYNFARISVEADN